MKKKLKATAPQGYKGEIIATATNEGEHFSVTAEISTERQRERDDCQACGCLHNEILEAFPQLSPLVALHLCDKETGEPLHALANSFYWLAGALGGLGERYHGANGGSGSPMTAEQCMKTFANYIRVTPARAEQIAERVTKAAKLAFAECIEEERPRWKSEAIAGKALLESLAD
jgi:hypothetical protein